MKRAPWNSIPLAACAASLVLAPAMVPSARAADITYSFVTLNNMADPTFNRLLGINTAGTISGYFGAGTMTHPNKGYTLAPPYGQGNYTNENFPNSFQTQVVGINSLATPATVGFYADTAGNNFGFVDQNGAFTSVSDPNTPTTAPCVNQLLGVDGNGDAQGYLHNINTQSFTPVMFPGAMMTTATGVNDSIVISGFYMDAMCNLHGFLDIGGTFMSLDEPNGANTMFLGLNNQNQAVGSFVNAAGVTNGFVYNFSTSTWQTVNDPNASPNPAFDVTGTTINGINDKGQLVGFYSDGTNVDGLLASQVPEPGSQALAAIGVAGGGGGQEKEQDYLN